MLVAAAYYYGHASPTRYVGATWFDQSHYLTAARAWAALSLDPARHWYFPGYPLLGAAFVGITPAQPFWVPDLLCLLASIGLAAALARRLVPGWRWAGVAGAFAVLATTAFWPRALQVWTIPWTTTPTVPLTYAAMLMALRFRETLSPLAAGLCAASATGLAAFRPTEAMIVCATVPPFLAWWLVTAWPGPRRAIAVAASALAGGALPLLALGAAHVAVHGLDPGPYIRQSATIGFEWRLVPLRWVLLFLGPQPYLATHLPGGQPGGVGMVAAFPWIVPGLAGLAACGLAGGAGRRDGHALVGAVLAATAIVYLAYRDLHPDGLFRFENYHYFKGLLPLLGLYGILFVYRLARPRPGRALAAALGVLPLLVWRADLRPASGDAARVAGPHSVALPQGLAPLHDAVLVAAAGQWDQIYTGLHTLSAGGVPYAIGNADLKAYPVPGGLVVVPLRPLPAIDSVLDLGPTVRVDPAVPPVILHQVIRFGLPCIVAARQPACTVPRRAPAPSLPIGTTLAFGADEDAYLESGWATAEPGGRWTDGPAADIVVRPVRERPAPALALTLAAHAFPPDPAPMTVTLYAGDRAVASWSFATAEDRVVTARIPTGLLDADGSLRLRLAIERPVLAPGRRRLGLFVQSLRLDADEARSLEAVP